MFTRRSVCPERPLKAPDINTRQISFKHKIQINGETQFAE